MSGPSSAGISSSVGAENVKATKPTSSSSTVPHFLALRSTGTETSRSFMARSGFPLLATSSYLVQEIAQQVDALLSDFETKWCTAVSQFKVAMAGPTPSPFAIAKEVYLQRGWHYFQLYWSEHKETRTSIYHTFVRTLTDSLHELLPLLHTSEEGSIVLDIPSSRKVPASHVIRACGVLFALKLLQSTTALSFSDTDFNIPSARIPIEADLYHVLLSLPPIARTCQALGGCGDLSGLQPVDDVVYVILEMTGELGGKDDPVSTSEERDMEPSVGQRKGVFDVLVPTKYEARTALVNNCLSTKAEKERIKQKWGKIRSPGEEQEGAGMSRAELMRNLVREQLQLPLKGNSSSSDQHGALYMDPIKYDRRGHRRDKLPILDPLGGEVELDLQDCLDDVVKQRAEYEERKNLRVGTAEFTSLLPAIRDTFAGMTQPQTSSSTSSADLDCILAAARANVVQTLRQTMKDKYRNKIA